MASIKRTRTGGLALQVFTWASCMLLAASAVSANADIVKTHSSTVGSDGPARDMIGVYVRSIHNLDIKTSTAALDIFVWIRQARQSSTGNPLDRLEVINAQHVERSLDEVFVASNGDHIYSARLDILAAQHFDLHRYPLDEQVLELLFEDMKRDKQHLVWTTDQNSRLRHSMELTGWALGDLSLEESTRKHLGGLRVMQQSGARLVQPGEPLSPVEYSRIRLTIPLKRVGTGYFWKLFGAVFLASAVAFLCFFIKPMNLDPRFGLGVGALFTVVASNFVISSMLPETHLVTLGEKVSNISYLAIFFVIAESVIALYLSESGRERMAQRLDRSCGVALPILYIGGVSCILYMV